MKKTILILLLTLFVASGALAAEKRFKADLTFYGNDTDVVINSFELIDSRQLTPLNDESGNYKFSLRDSSGEVLYEGSRLVSFRAVGPPGPRSDQGYSNAVDTRSMSFWFNYSSEMETFEVRKNGELVEELSIADKVCLERDICSRYCESRDMCEGSRTSAEASSPIFNLDENIYLPALTAIVSLLLFMALYRVRND